MSSIEPIKLIGDWDEGWALDRHTISSEYIGEDPFGHPRYKTIRSEIGELMYQLKYQESTNVISEITATVVNFLNTNKTLKRVNAILPVPPSKNRKYQPVQLISEAVAREINIFYVDNVLMKTSSEQSKGMSTNEKSALSNTIICTRKAKTECDILLIDDIYETGSTLNECVRALRTDKNINKIFVLTMTKTMSKGR